MQLLTTSSIPSGPSGSSTLHKSALFPDTPERERELETSRLDSPQSRREPLSQRLRREFGLCADESSDLSTNPSASAPIAVPTAYPTSSFPTATVQTPNGPQQVFYVPQASNSVVTPRGGKSPLGSLGALAPQAITVVGGQRGAYGMGNGPHHGKASNLGPPRPRTNNGGSGAGYKPGFY